MDYAKLGDILQNSRSNAGFTQRQIADALGVTPQTVSSWELGKSRIDLGTLEWLCQEYQISFVQLMQALSPEAQAAVPHAPGVYAQAYSGAPLVMAQSPAEAQLLARYVQLDNHGAEMVNTVLELEYRRCAEAAQTGAYVVPGPVAPQQGMLFAAYGETPETYSDAQQRDLARLAGMEQELDAPAQEPDFPAQEPDAEEGE